MAEASVAGAERDDGAQHLSIGLAGGLNPYVFGENDPISMSDPLGLDSRRCSRIEYVDGEAICDPDDPGRASGVNQNASDRGGRPWAAGLFGIGRGSGGAPKSPEQAAACRDAYLMVAKDVLLNGVAMAAPKVAGPLLDNAQKHKQMHLFTINGMRTFARPGGRRYAAWERRAAAIGVVGANADVLGTLTDFMWGDHNELVISLAVTLWRGPVWGAVTELALGMRGLAEKGCL